MLAVARTFQIIRKQLFSFVPAFIPGIVAQRAIDCFITGGQIRFSKRFQQLDGIFSVYRPIEGRGIEEPPLIAALCVPPKGWLLFQGHCFGQSIKFQ